MIGRKEWLAALGLGVAVAAATLVPYAASETMVRGRGVFGGFLINPLDGFSYLAKMRQGAQGSWLFHLPYAVEPGPGASIFLYFLFLGHLAKWSGASLLCVYHAARFIGGSMMFGVAFLFFSCLLPSRGLRWAAYMLTLLGSGLGWIAMPLGIVSVDLWMPEVVPFLTAYSNAHFPLAAAAMLGSVVAIAAGDENHPGLGKRLFVGLVCGIVLGILQPFLVLSLGTVLGAWLGWEALRKLQASGPSAQRESLRQPFSVFLSFLAGAAPSLVYDLWLASTHPALAAWTMQNLTPSPPPLHFATGYGLILAFAIAGVLLARPFDRPGGRLLVTWVVVNAGLLYAPIGMQRRMALGLFFPLAALAAFGIQAVAARRVHLRTVLIATLILAVPSNVVVVGAGLMGVQRIDPALVLSSAEYQAYSWAAQNIPPGSVVLAAPETGNRLPAYADVRVLYGHPFETPDAESQRELVESLYAGDGSEDAALRALVDHHVEYVLYGAWEQALGAPGWLARLRLVYSSGGVEIYRVLES